VTPNRSLERTHYRALLSSSTCVPGMSQSERGESPRARYSGSRRVGEGQGRHREMKYSVFTLGDLLVPRAHRWGTLFPRILGTYSIPKPTIFAPH
jgi:hypothetical protein